MLLINYTISAQIGFEFYTGSQGVYTVDLKKNDKYLFVNNTNLIARSENGDDFLPLIKDKSGYLLVDTNNLYYLYFKKNFTFGLLYSMDNGDTWIEQKLPVSTNINTYSFKYNKGQLLISQNSANYIYHSDDHGANWDSTLVSEFIIDRPQIGKCYYIVKNNNVYKINSETDDSTFFDLKPTIGNFSFEIKEITAFGNTVFLRTFSNIICLDANVSYIKSNIKQNSVGFAIVENEMYIIQLNDVKKYDTLTSTWNTILPPNDFKPMYSYTKFKGNDYVGVNYQGVYKIDNEKNITTSGNGIDRERIYYAIAGEDFIVAQNGKKISIYNNEEKSWKNHFESGFSYNYQDITTDGKNMVAYLNIYNYSLEISFDKGKSWVTKDIPIAFDGFPITDYILKSFDNIIIITNGATNYFSKDYGDTWMTVLQGDITNCIVFKNKYYGGGYKNTFVSDNLIQFINKSNEYLISTYKKSKNYLFLIQNAQNINKVSMSQDGLAWIDITFGNKNISERHYFYEKNNYLYALGNYSSYKLDMDNKNNGWELLSNSAFFGQLFEINDKLYSSNAGIYEVFLEEISLSNVYIQDVTWITDDNNKIYLSKNTKQHIGKLYYEILIEKPNQEIIKTGRYVNEENGKLMMLFDGKLTTLIDYNLLIDEQIEVSNGNILKLNDIEYLENNLNLKLPIYNYTNLDNAQTKNVSYTTFIGDKNIVFFDDIVHQYNISNKIHCIFLNDQLLTSNNACGITSSTENLEVNVEMYPSPTFGKIFIKSNYQENLEIKFHTFMGKEISILNISDSCEFDISYLPHGLYIVSIYDNNRTRIKSQKLLKL